MRQFGCFAALDTTTASALNSGSRSLGVDLVAQPSPDKKRGTATARSLLFGQVAVGGASLHLMHLDAFSKFWGSVFFSPSHVHCRTDLLEMGTGSSWIGRQMVTLGIEDADSNYLTGKKATCKKNS